LGYGFTSAGRLWKLNVLAHVFDKPYAQILAESRDAARPANLTLQQEMGWTSEIRYDLGARRVLQETGSTPGTLMIAMPHNPSQVEAIAPVVQGMPRGAGTQAADAARVDQDSLTTHISCVYPGFSHLS
jgi:2-oxoglutarate dehydrogenase complex dehydrogenase (E1) component-like enzyme